MQQQMQTFMQQQMAHSSETASDGKLRVTPTLTPDQLQQLQQSFFLSMWASAHGGLAKQPDGGSPEMTTTKKTSLEAILTTVQQSDSAVPGAGLRLDGSMLNTAEALLQLSGTDESSASPAPSTGSNAPLSSMSQPMMAEVTLPQSTDALWMASHKSAQPIPGTLAQPAVVTTPLGFNFPSTRALSFQPAAPTTLP